MSGPNWVWDGESDSWVNVGGTYDSSLDSATTFDLATSAKDWLELAKQGITAFNSFELQQINFARARKGLAPLNPGAYSPQVGVNLAPDTMKMIMYGALGLGAIMLLKRSR